VWCGRCSVRRSCRRWSQEKMCPRARNEGDDRGGTTAERQEGQHWAPARQDTEKKKKRRTRGGRGDGTEEKDGADAGKRRRGGRAKGKNKRVGEEKRQVDRPEKLVMARSKNKKRLTDQRKTKKKWGKSTAVHPRKGGKEKGPHPILARVVGPTGTSSNLRRTKAKGRALIESAEKKIGQRRTRENAAQSTPEGEKYLRHLSNKVVNSTSPPLPKREKEDNSR